MGFEAFKYSLEINNIYQTFYPTFKFIQISKLQLISDFDRQIDKKIDR